MKYYFKTLKYEEGLAEKPEKIGKKIDDYIKGLVKSKETDYNDFVHSIWFCFSGTRLEESESEIIKNLIGVYKDNIMPIIFVYLQAVDKSTSEEMKDFINKTYENANFINVLAKDMEKKKAFGNKELLKKTMERCTKALQGEMIKLMTRRISEKVEKKNDR